MTGSMAPPGRAAAIGGVAPDRLEVWDSGIQPTVTLIDGGMEPQVSDSLFFPRPLWRR